MTVMSALRDLAPPATPGVPHPTARRLVFVVIVAAAAVVLVLSTITTITADPRAGEGWIGGPLEAILAGGPLVAVAAGLRSRRATTARRTAVGALVCALVAAFVLTMQLLDPNEIASDRAVQGVAIAVYLAAFVVELPAFGPTWVRDDPARR